MSSNTATTYEDAPDINYPQTFDVGDELTAPNDHEYHVASVYIGVNDSPMVRLQGMNVRNKMYMTWTRLGQAVAKNGWKYEENDDTEM
jgi:hypothetical protein